jgi:aldehyde:ferredoxin oxidoreductase
MLDEYYRLHEWDETGMPTPELLERLDISDLWPSGQN